MMIFTIKRIVHTIPTMYMIPIIRYGRSFVRVFTLVTKVYPVTTFPTPQAISVKPYIQLIVKTCTAIPARTYTIQNTIRKTA